MRNQAATIRSKPLNDSIMEDFFEGNRHDHVHKDEVEIVEKQKHEFKFVGRHRKVPGHTIFSLNTKTGEIKVAPISHSKDIDFKTRQPVTKDRIVIEPGCIYRQALNKKNFIKRLVREGILVKRQPQ